MRFGINTFLFSCPFTDASTRLFPKFKKWGFESVENFSHFDVIASAIAGVAPATVSTDPTISTVTTLVAFCRIEPEQ